MWHKLVSTKGTEITTQHLHLKNTLMNGQCFNWKCVSDVYVGCVGQNVIALKANNRNNNDNYPISYKFLYKSETDLNEAVFFHNYFQLEIDIDDLYTKAKLKLPEDLQNVMNTYQGIRIIKQEVFECIISFICSSNNNIERIKKMLESFRQTYGEPLYEDSTYGKFYSFPSLEGLINTIKEEELRQMGFGYRAKYIVNSIKYMNSKVSEGEDWIENLKTNENPLEELLQLTGVGRKVADCIQLFSLKKHNVVPLDVHMIKFYNEKLADMNKFKKIESMNKKTYEEVSKNYIKIFGDYAGWLHSVFYMNRIDVRSGGKRKVKDDEDDDVKKTINKNKKKKIVK